MATKNAQKTPTKIVKVEQRQLRIDGPVAKARSIFEKMKGQETPAILAACDKAGVNHGTATTQLGRWRKENGIVVKRGGPHNVKKTKPAKEVKRGKGKSRPVTVTRPEGKKKDNKSSRAIVKPKSTAIKPAATTTPVADSQPAGPTPAPGSLGAEIAATNGQA